MKGKIAIVFVYIKEAHASDAWPLGNVVQIPTHQTLEDRINAAKQFIAKTGFEIPILVDGMENKMCSVWGAWPERYFILKDQQVLHALVPDNLFGYDRLRVRRILRSMVGKDPLLSSQTDDFTGSLLQSEEESPPEIDKEEQEMIESNLVVHSSLPFDK